MTTRQPKAELVEIAALLDGRLQGEERARVLELLARDEASFDLFEESALALEEERMGEECAEEEQAAAPERAPRLPETAEIIPMRRSPKSPPPRKTSTKGLTYIALAATLAGAAIGAYFWLALGKGGSSALVASFAPEKLAAVRSFYPDQTRSKSAIGRFQAGRSAFVAAVLIQREASEALAEELRFMSSYLGTGSSTEEVVASIQKAKIALENREISSHQVARRLAGWEKELDWSDDFKLGRWCQAALLAVDQQDDAFFQSRRVLRLWRGARNNGTAPRESLATIDRLMESGVSGKEQREELDLALRRISAAFEPDLQR